MRTSFATISKQGARSNNEDYLLVMDRPEAKRLTGIVCDGMGGHSCGEVASLTVCNCIAHYWEQHTALPDSPEKVLEACRKASAAMDRKAAEEGIAEMGTTLVMASIEADSVTIAHVGDSRCYVQRPGDGLIYQIEDHKVNVNGRQMLLCRTSRSGPARHQEHPTAGGRPHPAVLRRTLWSYRTRHSAGQNDGQQATGKDTGRI